MRRFCGERFRRGKKGADGGGCGGYVWMIWSDLSRTRERDDKMGKDFVQIGE